ncbi:MAG TPA: ribosome small subunit-dependent GTPase A [bacterium]|nr:ribosome small subunit-dependent GTPase A [bacterium]
MHDPHPLSRYGWDPARPFDAAPGLQPGRVTLVQKGAWRVATAEGEGPAEVAGKLLYAAGGAADLPSVGDWVAVAGNLAGGLYVIQQVLPRTSKFSRKVAGTRVEEQVVAANIDTVFLVTALDGDFNLRRIERYLQVAWASGAEPVVLLTKADVAPDLAGQVAAVAGVAMGARVLAISVHTGDGLGAFSDQLQPGRTYALLGSSGVGKSTLLNHLLGQSVQKTQEVRADDSRGRHTTTHRELFVLPNGALLIDTPGMRELQLWASGEDSGDLAAFPDIAALAEGCRYADCSHAAEPGCTVQGALESGELDPDRWESYCKLKRELEFIERKADKGLEAAQKAKWKAIHKSMRGFSKG